MNKIQLVKKYTYISICNIDFNVLIYFDYDNEVLLYSLKYEDNNYSSSDYLIEYATSLNDDEINNTIKSFMLNYVKSNLNCYIKESKYANGSVEVCDNGIELINNNNTKQHVDGWLYDYDEDYELIQNKIKKFLDGNNQR